MAFTTVLDLHVGTGALEGSDLHRFKAGADRAFHKNLRLAGLGRAGKQKRRSCPCRLAFLRVAHNQIHAGNGGKTFGGGLRQTAGHHDRRIGISGNGTADELACLAVGLGGYGAGVDEIQITDLGRREDYNAEAAKLLRHRFGFILVDLTAKGKDTRSIMFGHSLSPE